MRKVADYQKMGERIKEARRNAKITQVQLAAACDCDSKHISAIENGTKNPSLDLLLIASDKLNESPYSYELVKRDGCTVRNAVGSIH